MSHMFVGKTAPDKVDELREAVKKLSREELDRFGAWFHAFFDDAWDRQMKADAEAGRLDQLAEQALRDLDAGRCTER